MTPSDPVISTSLSSGDTCRRQAGSGTEIWNPGQRSVSFRRKYDQHLAVGKRQESPRIHTSRTGVSEPVQFRPRITVQLHRILNTQEPLGGTLKSLCSVEISILVVVVGDLIFIALFLAAVKFHFHQLRFLSGKKSLRKYSKHCSQQSSQI